MVGYSGDQLDSTSLARGVERFNRAAKATELGAMSSKGDRALDFLSRLSAQNITCQEYR
jgi:hypothetical protein